MFSKEEQAVLLKQQENTRAMWELLRLLKERYGDKICISVVDSRSPIVLWYAIRYGAWSTFTTWILNGRKIFEVIPKREELERIIDSELQSRVEVSA